MPLPFALPLAPDDIAAIDRATLAAVAPRLIEAEGQTVAVGVLGPGTRWSGIHGMRTAQRWRGKGLATRILATLAGATLERGIERLFPQVEADNPAAERLYPLAGFTTEWTYRYWSCDRQA